MRIYPISVPRSRYAGRNETKRRRAREYDEDAEMLENYLNQQIASDDGPIQTYIYGFIAPDVGLSTERVREILFAVDCGHNGLTVAKSEQAWRDFFRVPQSAKSSV